MCRCSVDPYLFENFNTVDGDFLTAKFRAFKFPESTYVQFRGTVNVCLDKCSGVCIDFILSQNTQLLNFSMTLFIYNSFFFFCIVPLIFPDEFMMNLRCVYLNTYFRSNAAMVKLVLVEKGELLRCQAQTRTNYSR